MVVSPIKMARVAAAIARQGRIPVAQWRHGGATDPATRPAKRAPCSEKPADGRGRATLAEYMREVVTSGTGRVLAANATPIAGKTGTAEVDGAPAHSWFVGYAPFGNDQPQENRVCRDPGKRRLRGPGRGAARGRPGHGGARARTVCSKRTERAMTITGIRKGWDRVKNLLDGRPGPDFKPLDVLAAVLNEIEARVVPAGGGRRVFPHNRIGVKVLLPPGAERSRFEVALDELESKIRKRFHEIDCEAAYPLDVRIQFLKKAPAAWSAEQIVALDLQKGAPDQPGRDDGGGVGARAGGDCRGCEADVYILGTLHPAGPHRRDQRSPWRAAPQSRCAR